MKTLLKYLFFLSLTTYTVSAQVQDAGNAPYVGTWKYQNGNNIFRLIITEDPEPNPTDGAYYLIGHYQMSHVLGNSETLTYTSDPADTAVKMHSAFSGTHMANGISGFFREIHTGGSGMKGNFYITSEPVCSGCPLQIHWQLSHMEGVRFVDENTPADFVVPQDIVLTKE